jgi:hypothetical protein
MSGRRIEARTRGQQHSPGVTAFQLWLALPPELENGPAEGICVSPEAVP